MMFTVNCQVYPFEILVCFGTSKKQLIKKCSNKRLKSLDFKQGKSIMFTSGQTLLWLKNKPTTISELGVLNHEIFHCTCFILERVGIRYSDSSDEAFAYLIQYISIEIYKNIGITFS